MPLNPEDPYYQAEETPSSIKALGVGLCAAYRRPAAAFGAKGNKIHLYGYHRSRRWILNSPDSRYGSRDYSVIRILDQGGDPDLISAFDFTPGEWGTKQNRTLMVEITTRVYEAAKARDPRLFALREFAGTIDGKTVITFNCADGSLKDPFDSTHLDHGHGSIWRSYAAANHSGILAVMLGEPIPQRQRRLKMFIGQDDAGKRYWFNGVESREIPEDQRGHAVYLAQQIGAKGTGAEWIEGGYVRTGWYPELYGPVRHLGNVEVAESTVVAALASDAGQAALVRAHETSEDS